MKQNRNTFDIYSSWADAFKYMEDLNGSIDKYPPHDVIKTSDNEYQVVMAVAGFTKKDISVTLQGDSLVVTGAKIKSVEDLETDSVFPQYIHTGISKRSFKKSFRIQEGVSVTKASVRDGLLTIDLVYELNDKKTVTINID